MRTPRHTTATLLLALCSLSLWRCDCDNGKTQSCDPRCGLGFECEVSLKLCVSNQLEVYQGPLPGRAVRAVALDQGVLTAVIDPKTQSVIIERSDQSPRLLATGVRPGIHRLSVARRADRVLLAWVSQEGVFNIAEHRGDDFSRNWTTQAIRPRNEQGVMDYQATIDFDVALSTQGGAHLAFRDGKTGGLFHLSRAQDTAQWSYESIDDGQSALSPEPCPLSTRTQRGLGVGREPDLIGTDSGELLLAYHDGDCGDLRLARKGAANWIVALVDRGEQLAESITQTSVTGRWPSVQLRLDGIIGISYQDLTLGRLMYAESTTEGFRKEVVDEGVDFDLFSKRPKKIVGAYSTLSFDAQHVPLISYFDATRTALMTASLTQSSPRRWSIKARQTEGLVGFFASHVRRASGLVYFTCEQLVPTPEGMQSKLVTLEEER